MKMLCYTLGVLTGVFLVIGYFFVSDLISKAGKIEGRIVCTVNGEEILSNKILSNVRQFPLMDIWKLPSTSPKDRKIGTIKLTFKGIGIGKLKEIGWLSNTYNLFATNNEVYISRVTPPQPVGIIDPWTNKPIKPSVKKSDKEESKYTIYPVLPAMLLGQKVSVDNTPVDDKTIAKEASRQLLALINAKIIDK